MLLLRRTLLIVFATVLPLCAFLYTTRSAESSTPDCSYEYVAPAGRAQGIPYRFDSVPIPSVPGTCQGFAMFDEGGIPMLSLYRYLTTGPYHFQLGPVRSQLFQDPKDFGHTWLQATEHAILFINGQNADYTKPDQAFVFGAFDKASKTPPVDQALAEMYGIPPADPWPNDQLLSDAERDQLHEQLAFSLNTADPELRDATQRLQYAAEQGSWYTEYGVPESVVHLMTVGGVREYCVRLEAAGICYAPSRSPVPQFIYSGPDVVKNIGLFRQTLDATGAPFDPFQPIPAPEVPQIDGGGLPDDLDIHDYWRYPDWLQFLCRAPALSALRGCQIPGNGQVVLGDGYYPLSFNFQIFSPPTGVGAQVNPKYIGGLQLEASVSSVGDVPANISGKDGTAHVQVRLPAHSGDYVLDLRLSGHYAGYAVDEKRQIPLHLSVEGCGCDPAPLSLPFTIPWPVEDLCIHISQLLADIIAVGAFAVAWRWVRKRRRLPLPTYSVEVRRQGGQTKVYPLKVFHKHKVPLSEFRYGIPQIDGKALGLAGLRFGVDPKSKWPLVAGHPRQRPHSPSAKEAEPKDGKTLEVRSVGPKAKGSAQRPSKSEGGRASKPASSKTTPKRAARRRGRRYPWDTAFDYDATTTYVLRDSNAIFAQPKYRHRVGALRDTKLED